MTYTEEGLQERFDHLNATIYKLQIGIRNRDSFIEAISKALLAIASNEVDQDVILKGIADMIDFQQELINHDVY